MASSQDNSLILAEMPERPKDPLVYDNDTDTSNIQNIMLIDATISSRQIFVDSANTNTFPIIYSYYSDSNELLELLQSKFTHINRVSFVFHDPLEKNKAFLDEKSFFTNDDLILEQSVFSENVSFLKSLITQFSISNIDFLACNSLLYENWKTFYGLLTQETNVIVGASDNLSGNIKYGADWVLENTNADVRTIYFNDTILDFSEYLQPFSISQSGGNISFRQDGSDIQYSSDDLATWTNVTGYPINIVNTSVSSEVLTVKFTADMVFTTSFHYFTCGSEYITFDGLKDDGNRATITFNDVSNCLGLIQNGIFNGGGSANIIVQNIHVASSGTTTLASEAGWVCHSHYGKNCLNLKVDNCSSDGQILAIWSGGILGQYACANSAGTLEISNCYSTGDIGGSGAGGICAPRLALNGGKVTITNCYSTGLISDACGGICGQNAVSVNGDNSAGELTITNCYSTGQMSGISAGGICGSAAASNGSTYPGGKLTITNCYSTGEILGNNSGGICGNQAGRNQGTVKITNCYSTGDIPPSGGGICGAQTGLNNGNVDITNCYSRGEIFGNNSGGICGNQTGRSGTVTISNCYSEGEIVGSLAGGICGLDTGYDSGIVDISNCYSTGVINSQAGGICGAGTTGTTITNSYSLYATDGAFIGSRGMVASGNATFNDTYGANGTWSSADANSKLTGIPTGSAKEGDVWGYHAVNTPYYLMVMPTLPYSQNGGTISFRQNDAVIQYSPDNSSSSWTDLSNVDFPINIVNTTTGNNLLTVKFITDMGFTTQSHYFKCGSEYITFDGLKDNQDRATITFNDVPNCPGLIQNGDSGTNGYSNITVQNIHVATSGTTTLAYYAGWVCQRYFGTGSSDALIDNCYSTGLISNHAGGICGEYAASGSGGTLEISNCYSEGDIGDSGGGICGGRAAFNGGSVTVTNCYSTGRCGSGGICGTNAGSNYGTNPGGTVYISNCYSTGQISNMDAGGICGEYAASNNGTNPGGTVTISNCYSTGHIAGDYSGGICGKYAAANNGAVTISNCYSEGEILGADSGGICGMYAGVNSGSVDITNSYSLYATDGAFIGSRGMVASGNATLNDTYGANGTWSSADANSKLTGIPTGSAKEGDVWGYHAVNTPYYLMVMPTLPYSQNGGTISFRQDGAVIQYSPDNSSSSWTDLSNVDFPININNTTTGNNLLTVKFITDMSFTTQSHYFKCGSEYITFDGLKDNQDRATITFNDVPDCPGLIQNGDIGTNGYSNITVQNIHVASFGSTTLANFAGWVCQQYFGKGSSFALIDNCYSTGQIGSLGAGGICGENAGTLNGVVEIFNCYSTGEIVGADSGGICGKGTAFNSGTVTISDCYSTGKIKGADSGGICGENTGTLNGTATISNCYSTGQIFGNNSGGICGKETGMTSGTVTISNCYSEGEIFGSQAGGICGQNTGLYSGTVNISNCYSTGVIVGSPAGGICGAGTTGTTITNSYSLYATDGALIGSRGMVASGYATLNDTYGANGTWSSADANSKLTGTPAGPAKEGDVWGYHAVNTPYYLMAMPTMPYSQNGGTISFRQDGAVIQYSPDNSSSSWTDLSNVDFPININNTTTGNNLLTVKFITDMSFTTQSHYFKCGSEYITFDGLKDDQARATITFNDVPDCPGLIQNGDSGTNGYSNIAVQNIHVASFGSTTLANFAGWVCQQYFGKGSSFALIDNCYSTGEIGSLSAGGICGNSTGSHNGVVEISNCYSTGVISAEYGGGICGIQAGAFNGDATISNCYSTGEIKGANSGGICGSRSGYSSGTVDISNCYSTGVINSQAGGICGDQAGVNGTVTIANSYSLYANGNGNGIEPGGMVVSGLATLNDTYGANGTWSSTDANSKLTGTPTGSAKEGVVWSYHIVNTRYYLTATPTAPPSLEEITTPLVLDNILSSVLSSDAYTIQQITTAFPEPTATVSKFESIDFILKQTHWNTIKIEDSISGITSFVNKTTNNVKFVTTKLITLTR